MSHPVYISLGSNQGDSMALLQQALAELAPLSEIPLRVSRFYVTPPVDCPPGSPDFVNAAALLEVPANETPETLLPKLQAVETKFGRKPKVVMNEPRPLDLDLIVFANEQRRTPRLILPHPRAHTRAFVLAPLADINPNLILPGHTLTVRELLKLCPEADSVLLAPPGGS